VVVLRFGVVVVLCSLPAQFVVVSGGGLHRRWFWPVVTPAKSWFFPVVVGLL
jgi:hypothetical protein